MNNCDLVFDETNHIYRKDGIIKPSVTQILQEIGLVEYSAVPKEVLERASNFGTAVHRTTELSDKNILDYSSVSNPIIPYLKAWQNFVDTYQIDNLAIEKQFYCAKYDYCGTIDRIVYSKTLKRKVLIDIKTTASISPTVNLQTAGYAIGIEEPNITRMVVQLKENNYRAVVCDSPTDTAYFLSALNVWKWKKLNKLIKKEQ